VPAEPSVFPSLLAPRRFAWWTLLIKVLTFSVQALPLMLQGKSLKAEKAKSLKIIDVVADPSALEHAAITVCVS